MLKIVIDLKESADAHHFFDPSKESETHTRIVHKRQFELVTGWIKERIERLGELDDLGPIDFKDTQEENRPHDTITILGTRGSGKTSFLLSIREKYKKSKIAVLKIIDPTLIEEKGHVFLNIVSMIKDEVNKKLDTRS
jgi:Cdc6-like AAA superfamily ATPase